MVQAHLTHRLSGAVSWSWREEELLVDTIRRLMVAVLGLGIGPVVSQTLTPPGTPGSPGFVTLAPGTAISIRLSGEISSKKAKVGDTFHGTTSSDITASGVTIIGTGTQVTGFVAAAKAGGRVSGAAQLTLQLTSIRLNGSTGPQEVTVATDPLINQGEGKGGSTAARTGGGAALGGLLGAVTGGGTGAVVGAVGGGAVGAGSSGVTKGKQIDLKTEQLLQFRLSTRLDVATTPNEPQVAPSTMLQTRPLPQ